jgi:hypothetical protein
MYWKIWYKLRHVSSKVSEKLYVRNIFLLPPPLANNLGKEILISEFANGSKSWVASLMCCNHAVRLAASIISAAVT